MGINSKRIIVAFEWKQPLNTYGQTFICSFAEDVFDTARNRAATSVAIGVEMNLTVSLMGLERRIKNTTMLEPCMKMNFVSYLRK